MNETVKKLRRGELPAFEEFERLITGDCPELSQAAGEVCRERFGGRVYLRALIEYTNYCRNDCLYCGIRRSAKRERYVLDAAQIVKAAEKAYRSGLRTVVLQGGESPAFDGILIDAVKTIKRKMPDTAVTLSAGERTREVYEEFKRAGADRYLLRHESADEALYARLHPSEMSWKNRMRALCDVRETGFQTGAGFMVGAPGQTTENLYSELKFINGFRPEMLGIGPFIPACGTPLGNFPAGNAELTLKLVAIFRLLLPNALIPSTTALATLERGGRYAAIAGGANVVMPNFTPVSERGLYEIYDGKEFSGEAEENLALLLKELKETGFEAALFDRGDYKEI